MTPMKYDYLMDFRPLSTLVFYAIRPLDATTPVPNHSIYWKSKDFPQQGPFPSLWVACEHYKHMTTEAEKWNARPTCDVVSVDFRDKKRI